MENNDADYHYVIFSAASSHAGHNTLLRACQRTLYIWVFLSEVTKYQISM